MCGPIVRLLSTRHEDEYGPFKWMMYMHISARQRTKTLVDKCYPTVDPAYVYTWGI